MPAVADRGTSVVDMSGYTPVEKPFSPPMGGLPTTNLEPGYNVYLRCPLPPVWSSTSDTLRQFYRNNQVPQVRLFNPPNPTNTGGGGTTTINVSSGSSSSGSSTTTTLSVANTSFKTPSISANGRFTGTVNLGTAFHLMTVTANAPCRIQLYGTAAAQLADAYRGIDVPLPAGTMQNIICDVVLDTTPYTWGFQDRVGSNGENPVTATTYITVTNLDVTTDIFTLSFEYVPLVS